MFNVNSPIIFVLVAIIILIVMAQSVFFLIRALKQAKKIGMKKEIVNKTIKNAAIFTIAPAIAIVVSVITLSQSLGIALPWFRLSVVGSLSYETIAAQNALSGMGMELGKSVINNAQAYVTVAFVMTISIMVGIILSPLIGKKLQNGLISLGKKDKAWSEIFQNSLFIGMIAAFLGFVFCDVFMLWTPQARFVTVDGVKQAVSATYGLIPVLVMASSALIMLLLGLLVKLTKAKWISDYALPISMICGMLMAIPITNWLA